MAILLTNGKTVQGTSQHRRQHSGEAPIIHRSQLVPLLWRCDSTALMLSWNVT